MVPQCMAIDIFTTDRALSTIVTLETCLFGILNIYCKDEASFMEVTLTSDGKELPIYLIALS